MLLATRPGHRQTCTKVQQGCTCFYFNGAYGKKAKTLRRRIARRVENRTWRSDIN